MNVSKSKVLLVEDSKFLRVASERALSRAGFRVAARSFFVPPEISSFAAIHTLPSPRLGIQDVLFAVALRELLRRVRGYIPPPLFS